MIDAHFGIAKETGKTLLMLIALGITARWGLALSSLLATEVLLQHAARVWQPISAIPRSTLQRLLAALLVLGVAAGIRYETLTITGLSLIILLPLVWKTGGSSRPELRDRSNKLKAFM